jgi:hypothetical protein
MLEMEEIIMTQEELSQAIDIYDQYLQRMTEATVHFCEDLVESNYQEISGVLPAIVEGLAWINEALEKFLKLNYIAEEDLIAFREFIGKLYEALENKDYVLLHDLCEFELEPLLDSIYISETPIN